MSIIKVPYRLDVKNPLTKTILKMHNHEDYRSFDQEVNKNEILHSVSSIRETEKFVFFKTNRGLMMLNKNTLIIENMWYFHDESSGVRLFRYQPHEGDDNRIMFFVNSSDWLKRKPTDENIPEHLKSQIENVKVDENIESNPILVYFKEK